MAKKQTVKVGQEAFKVAVREILDMELMSEKVTNKKDGTIEVRHSYFYRFGSTPDGMARKLERLMPFAVAVESGDEWAAWPKTSYFMVKLALKSGYADVAAEQMVQMYADVKVVEQAAREAKAKEEAEARKAAFEAEQKASEEAAKQRQAEYEAKFREKHGWGVGDVVQVWLSTWDGYFPTVLAINGDETVVNLKTKRTEKQYTLKTKNIGKKS